MPLLLLLFDSRQGLPREAARVDCSGSTLCALLSSRLPLPISSELYEEADEVDESVEMVDILREEADAEDGSACRLLDVRLLLLLRLFVFGVGEG